MTPEKAHSADAGKTEAEVRADLATLRDRLAKLEGPERPKTATPHDRLAEELRRIYKDLPVGLCFIGTDLRYVQVNDWLAAINGIPAAEHIGRTMSELIPEIAAGVEAQFQQVIDTGEPIIGGTVVAETPAQPGVKRHFRHSYYPVRSDAGEVIGISCVVEDVTDRIEAVAALRESHTDLERRVQERTAEFQKINEILNQEMAQRLRAEEALSDRERYTRGIMENIADTVATIDERGTVQSFNPAGEEMFGYAAADVRGRNVSMLMPEPDHSKHDRYLSAYQETGKGKILGVGSREVTGRRKDGSTFPMELTVGKMTFSGKTMFVGAMRDITGRKETEALLQQAQKMEAIGQLTGGVAHDFNNLLTIILGNLDLLQDHLLSNPAARKLVDTAAKASERGADLTHRLLAYSRKQPLKPGVTGVNRLITDSTELLRRTLGEDIEIVVVLAGNLSKAMVDPKQLDNAILNLAINARDAMPDGGKLTIETANVRLDNEYTDSHEDVTPGGYVLIEVSDTGTGMSADVIEKAFDPFFTTKDVGQGSGLGLSMVYGFTKQTGGHAAIYSELGQGTTIKLYLPMAIGAGDLTGIDPDQKMPLLKGSETILVVEDDEEVRNFVSTALKSVGYRVIEATDGETAIALVDKNPHIELLVTDVVLPHGMNGREVAETVEIRLPNAKILFISGYAENAVVHQGKLDEGVEMLSKPFTREILARRVRQILDTPQK